MRLVEVTVSVLPITFASQSAGIPLDTTLKIKLLFGVGHGSVPLPLVAKAVKAIFAEPGLLTPN